VARKKFKRYFTGSANRTEPGKGSDRREPMIPPEEEARRWCQTFGHKIRYGFCTQCGESFHEQQTT
jgi:hypothetical protein